MDPRPDPRAPIAPGTILGGRYRVVALLGEGGMGRVYEAEHVRLGRKVALKVLRRDQARDEATVRRFEQEARAAGAIGHPAIVGIEDFDRTDDGEVFLAMELLEGRTLEEALADGGTLDEAVAWLADVAEGLAAAHEAGVLHRDVKPGNVFVIGGPGDRTRAKILDFGIAKLVDDEHAVRTEMGTVLGTPYYLAPERAQGKRLDPRADLYSLGVILYEVLTGNVPFVDDSFMGVLAKHMREPPLDPRQAAPERPIPDELANLTMALLAKSPDDRPQTAAAVAASLRRILAEHGPVLATIPFGPRGRTASPDEPTMAVAAGPAETTTPPAEALPSPFAPGPGISAGSAPASAVTTRLEPAAEPEPTPAATDPAGSEPDPAPRRRPWLAVLGIAGAGAAAAALYAGAGAADRARAPVSPPASNPPRAAVAPAAVPARIERPMGAVDPAAPGPGSKDPGGPGRVAHAPADPKGAAAATGAPVPPPAPARSDAVGSAGSAPADPPRKKRPRRRKRRRPPPAAPAAGEAKAPSPPPLPPPPELKDDVYDDK